MLIALTGGIGCGKSIISDLLRVMGYQVYDCDSQAKRLMQSDKVLIKDLIRIFGEQTYYSDGTLNKKYLSKCIFGNTGALNEMNAAIHPAVCRELLSIYKLSEKDKPFFYESAILYESSFDKLAVPDLVISVTAPLALRIERVMKRDCCTKEAVISRLNSQMDQKEKDGKADYVIFNDDKHSIIDQIDELLDKIQ